MKYFMKETDLKQVLLQVYDALSKVEVKGDSVEHLFGSRVILKGIIQGLQELPDENKEREDE